ncbi:MAG: hypothetical protein JSU85_01645 [Candidatus Zixiibacteriota bacterium]|nr:MAG: hypothetical protein JSU85_01645 [candidate division Zixibacteria bacterium]
MNNNDRGKNIKGPWYQFKPLYKHIDEGFGAIAEAFSDAAQRLNEVISKQKFANSSIPLSFLYRHSIGLFLKSLIIILHRKINIPFENHKWSKYAIKSEKGVIPLENIHEIKILYYYFRCLLNQNNGFLKEFTNTDWNSIPNELEDWIDEIDKFDVRSTVFRYPGLYDELKSDFKESAISDIRPSIDANQEPIKAFLEVDKNDNIANVYKLDNSRLQSIIIILEKALDILSTIHFAARCELGNGS